MTLTGRVVRVDDDELLRRVWDRSRLEDQLRWQADRDAAYERIAALARNDPRRLQELAGVSDGYLRVLRLRNAWESRENPRGAQN